MLKNYGPDIKIIILSLMFSAILIVFALLVMYVSIWISQKRKSRQILKRMKAEWRVDEEAKTIFRKKQAREARRYTSDRIFQKELKEILK